MTPQRQNIDFNRCNRDNQSLDFKKKYKLQNKLGEGTYGEVYKAYDRDLNIDVAIKKVKEINNSSDGVPQSMLREVSILRQIKHENVVSLNNVHMDIEEKQLWLVFEFIDLDLGKLIKDYYRNEKKISQSKIQKIMRKIIIAVNFMHQNGVLHRDLKPANILVTKDCKKIKIADLGLSRQQTLMRDMSPEIFTLWYRAPEIMLGDKEYGVGVDIWAIGCIMAELFLLKPLLSETCEVGCLFQIFHLQGTPNDKIWPGINKQPNFESKRKFGNFTETEDRQKNKLYASGADFNAIDLIDRFLRPNPQSRCTLNNALEHPFFLKQYND